MKGILIKNTNEADLIVRLRRLNNIEVKIDMDTIARITSGKQMESEIAFISKNNNLRIEFEINHQYKER